MSGRDFPDIGINQQPDTCQNERDGQQLSHIQQHLTLELHLRFFDELDAGNEYWGTEVCLGLAEGGVGIVTDKNFDKFASAETKAAVAAAEEAVLSGAIVVDTAIGENAVDAVAIRDAVRP